MKVTIEAKDILEKQINSTAAEYPPGLRPKHLKEIMDCTQTQIYDALNNGDIPGAKKIAGMGWRIPKETFLAWWFGSQMVERKKFIPVRRLK